MVHSMEENQNNFRFEKKFTVDSTKLSSVLYELRSKGFFKISLQASSELPDVTTSSINRTSLFLKISI